MLARPARRREIILTPLENCKPCARPPGNRSLAGDRVVFPADRAMTFSLRETAAGLIAGRNEPVPRASPEDAVSGLRMRPPAYSASNRGSGSGTREMVPFRTRSAAISPMCSFR